MNDAAPANPASDCVAFSISINAQERECSISREALNTLSKLKNIDSTDADTLELFKAFETFIRPVAQSICNGKISQAPLRLTPENMESAYSSPIKFKSAIRVMTFASQNEVRKDTVP
ncbi:DUF1488 family protein [Noviherbaspirillum sp. CPCC 100848]|uniref:DUF1488 family protein n=1 Tax=Noviherbaspirillum album TaxID=3080276 RepID=A0ABU6J963_9BURK|nr:DUF1488 family protein [Noviherbaspirillum sp. CPCC 100848]MEC4719817.1 DUF1488 family protein [Noviherbaspirillum sp. CPCC 100848]